MPHGPETTRLTTQLLAVAERYCTRRDIQLSSLGSYAMNNREFFDRVSAGVIRADQYDRVIAYLDQHWPEGLLWPAEVPRPRKPRGG